jgi:hypothetical protein
MYCFARRGVTCRAKYGTGPVMAAIKLSCCPAATFDLSRSEIRVRTITTVERMLADTARTRT